MWNRYTRVNTYSSSWAFNVVIWYFSSIHSLTLIRSKDILPEGFNLIKGFLYQIRLVTGSLLVLWYVRCIFNKYNCKLRGDLLPISHLDLLRLVMVDVCMKQLPFRSCFIFNSYNCFLLQLHYPCLFI